MVHRRCPAKVNLALSVGSPRDDGYHPIASWMVAVDLVDDLTVERLADDQPSTFDIDWASDAMRPTAIDWPLKRDLVWKAHSVVEGHVGRMLPVAVKLRKRIPVGAGLAGGASNGAAMISAVDEMFDLRLPHAPMTELVCRLGSDLAFFFHAPSAIVTGRGEFVDPVPLGGTIHLVLMTPRFACATGAVYRSFDEVSADAEVDESRVREVADQWPLPDEAPFNDLAGPACRVAAPLDELRRQVHRAVGRPVHITGSGSGMFIVVGDADEARQIAGLLEHECHLPARAVRTINRDAD